MNHFTPKIDSWAALNHLTSLSSEQVCKHDLGSHLAYMYSFSYLMRKKQWFLCLRHAQDVRFSFRHFCLTAETTREINDLVGQMRKNNRAARVA